MREIALGVTGDPSIERRGAIQAEIMHRASIISWLFSATIVANYAIKEKEHNHQGSHTSFLDMKAYRQRCLNWPWQWETQKPIYSINGIQKYEMPTPNWSSSVGAG